MNISKEQSSKKQKIIVLLVLTLIVVGTLIYAYAKNNISVSDSDNQSSNEESSETSGSVPADKEKAPNTDTTPPPRDTNESKDKAIVQMTASVSISNSTVSIRGGINNTGTYTGSCYAELRGPRGEVVRKETTLLQNASTTDCKTITVEGSELGSGSWTVQLFYSSDDVEGASNEVLFEI